MCLTCKIINGGRGGIKRATCKPINRKEEVTAQTLKVWEENGLGQPTRLTITLQERWVVSVWILAGERMHV